MMAKREIAQGKRLAPWDSQRMSYWPVSSCILLLCVLSQKKREQEIKKEKGREIEETEHRGEGKNESVGTESFAVRFGGGLEDNFKAATKYTISPLFLFIYFFKCCLEQSKLKTNKQTNSTSLTQSETQHKRDRPRWPLWLASVALVL